MQDECSDITTNQGEWKVLRKPIENLGLTDTAQDLDQIYAQDHCGNLWGIRIEVDYFYKRPGVVNTNIDD